MRIMRVSFLSLLCVFLLAGCSWQDAKDTAYIEGTDAGGLYELAEHELKQEMLDLALSYKPLYEQMERRTSNSDMITEDGISEIIGHIAKHGYTVTAFYHNMENYQQFDAFMENVEEGIIGSSYYYMVNNNGGFARMDFQYEDGRLYITESTLAWDAEMNPVVTYFSNFKIVEKWKYTEKGYLIYKPTTKTKLYALLRVKPLGAQERELCSAYIASIGYQGNNLFLVDWDQDDMTSLALNDLFDSLFYIDTGENTKYDLSTDSIPAEEFEPLFEKYFGITPEYLREHAIYYDDIHEYFWNYLTYNKHIVLIPAPTPEVVDSWENEDGTITMVVDALDDDHGNDRAFTHEVTVRVHEDGSFQYISNCIWPEDKPRVPGYTPRSEPFV